MTITGTVDRGTRVPPSTLRGRLRDAREWRGLEQYDIAEELGIGRSTVSNYEKGITHPKKLVINAWAVACDVDVEWLKTGKVADNPDPGDDVESTTAQPPAALAQLVERFTRNDKAHSSRHLRAVA